jgi:environmental stress-induced protein Ves
VTLTRDAPPHAFAADIAAAADLVAGPVVDLNFMSRRGWVRHRLTRLDLDNSLELARAGEMAIFCAEGAVRFETGDGSADLAEHDSLIWSKGSAATLRPQSRALIYLVNIDRG